MGCGRVGSAIARKLAQDGFDVAILDVNLKGERIWPVADRLREMGIPYILATGGHIALTNPADPNSPQAETVIEDFTAYKNRNGGIWARGEVHTFKNLKLADNAIGFTHASGIPGIAPFTSRVVG